MLGDTSAGVHLEFVAEVVNGSTKAARPGRIDTSVTAIPGGRIGLFGKPYCPTFSRMRFIWDTRKAAANRRKHGVTFDEAATAFEDELAAFYPDTLHADRFIPIGFSQRQRLLYVVHAEVNADHIRIISARKATRHEQIRYEND